MISNRQILIVRREIPHFFWFYIYHDLKQKIKFIDVPKYAFTHRNLFESEKYIWIIQNVHEKSWFFHISIKRQLMESLATRYSAVSAFTETVEFREHSLASMPIRYCCSMIGCCGFLFVLKLNVFYLTNLDN